MKRERSTGEEAGEVFTERGKVEGGTPESLTEDEIEAGALVPNGGRNPLLNPGEVSFLVGLMRIIHRFSIKCTHVHLHTHTHTQNSLVV